jgi:hypothetical protein
MQGNARRFVEPMDTLLKWFFLWNRIYKPRDEAASLHLLENGIYRPILKYPKVQKSPSAN